MIFDLNTSGKFGTYVIRILFRRIRLICDLALKRYIAVQFNFAGKIDLAFIDGLTICISLDRI